MATVLALEDDRLSQRLIEKIYRNAGHEVLLADSIKSGLGALRSRVLVDLVVLDSHLGVDLGWDFVGEVRRNPLFRQLPIIVYTGYTERQEVLRYAALKVQAVHVKPIRAEVLLSELERSTRHGARSRVLQEPEEVCARLQIDRREWVALLFNAVPQLLEDQATIARLAEEPRDPAFVQALQRLRSRGRELGLRWIEEMIAVILEQLQRGDRGNVRETAEALGAVLNAVPHQAGELLGAAGIITGEDREDLPAAAVPATPPPPLPSSNLTGAMAQQMIDRPLVMFGSGFARLRAEGVNLADLVPAALARDDEIPRGGWLRALGIIHSIPRSDLPDATTLLEQIPGMPAACQRVVRRVSRPDDTKPAAEEEVDMPYVINRLGVVSAFALAAVAHVVRPPVVSPLELQPLRHHCGATAILSLELGRLLRLPEPHQMPEATFARYLGVWALALTEPGITAVALARVAHGGGLSAAIEQVVGLRPGELGAALLAARQLPEWLQEVARVEERPDQAGTAEARIAGLVVQLAARLAHAAAADDPTELKALRSQLLQPDCPDWRHLRGHQVDVPRDTAEFVEIVVTLATTAEWTVRELAL
jgi:CheY-like chemotaxis protein